MKFHEQKLQAVRQILTEGFDEITPEQVAIALETDRKWTKIMFPLNMTCIIGGVPRKIQLEFSEFQELAPIVMQQEITLLKEMNKVLCH